MQAVDVFIGQRITVHQLDCRSHSGLKLEGAAIANGNLLSDGIIGHTTLLNKATY